VEGDTLLILYNVADVYIELQDESVLAGSKLRLGASSIGLNRYESAYFLSFKLAMPGSRSTTMRWPPLLLATSR